MKLAKAANFWSNLVASILVGCSIGIASAPTVAQAQVPQGAQSVGQSDELAEIVVSAQHREEDVQKVPISVAAFSAEDVVKQGITDVQSLATMVPGLQFTRQSSGSVPFLRGVGTPSAESGDEPSVAFYVDDVYMASGSASFANFNNIDRLEVEKGPQGTLFGRNADGGVIQVFTKNPTKDPMLDISVGYANYNTRSGSLYATSGLTDTLSANISLYGARQENGWGTNFATGNPVYTGWDYGARTKLLWTPSDSTSVLLNLDLDVTNNAMGNTFTPFAGTKEGVGGVPGFATAAATGYYNIDSNVDPSVIVRQSGGSVKVTQDFGWGQLVSISAYRTTHTEVVFDYAVSPLPLLSVTEYLPESQGSQEIRILSPKGSPITWTGGFYYFDSVAGYNPISFFGDFYTPTASAYTRLTTDSFAGFGQATATVLPDTHLTVGLRYTEDQRTVQALGHFVPPGGDAYVTVPAPNSPQSSKWPKVTYRFSLDHQFTADIMGYVAYNTGFKSGVFDTTVFPGAPINPPVKPETLDAYTVGAKSEFLDHRLRLNAEAFWYSYKNIQVAEYFSGNSILVNAAKATIKGVDIDAQVEPLQNFIVSASAEFLNGHYDSFPGGPIYEYNPVSGGNTVVNANLAGNPTIQTPPFSMTLSASYVIPLQELGSMSLNATASHTGNYYNAPDASLGQLSRDDDRQNIINIFNASVNWTSANGAWGTQLWGKNLTGVKYWNYSIEDEFATNYSAAPPRTYGLNLIYHFGADANRHK